MEEETPSDELEPVAEEILSRSLERRRTDQQQRNRVKQGEEGNEREKI